VITRYSGTTGLLEKPVTSNDAGPSPSPHANRHRLRAQVDAFNRRDRVENPPGGAAWSAHRSSTADSDAGEKSDRHGQHAGRASRACRPPQRHRHLSAVPDRAARGDGKCSKLTILSQSCAGSLELALAKPYSPGPGPSPGLSPCPRPGPGSTPSSGPDPGPGPTALALHP